MSVLFGSFEEGSCCGVQIGLELIALLSQPCMYRLTAVHCLAWPYLFSFPCKHERLKKHKGKILNNSLLCAYRKNKPSKSGNSDLLLHLSLREACTMGRKKNLEAFITPSTNLEKMAFSITSGEVILSDNRCVSSQNLGTKLGLQEDRCDTCLLF